MVNAAYQCKDATLADGYRCKKGFAKLRGMTAFSRWSKPEQKMVKTI